MIQKNRQDAKSANALTTILRSAVALHNQGKLLEAERGYNLALETEPDNPRALYMLGSLYCQTGRLGQAVAVLQRSVEDETYAAKAYILLGNALRKLGRVADAIEPLSRAAELNAHNEIAQCDFGIALAMTGRWADALPCFARAVSLAPSYAVGHYYNGETLKNMGRLSEALACYQRAVKLEPNFEEAWDSCGYAYYSLGQPKEALKAYQAVLRLNPDKPLLKGRVLYLKRICCDWAGTPSLIASIERGMASGLLAVSPFEWQAISDSLQNLQRCAVMFSSQTYPKSTAISLLTGQKGNKIRLGYVSGEFRDQATSHLLTGVLEHHDTSKFDVTLFDNGEDDCSEYRSRITLAANNIVDIKALTDLRAAEAIADANIDILINLNGYFGKDRTGVFAKRPSPLQVNFLGFPGTLGTDYMDYIIADERVIPQEERKYYNEKVVYLPDCYQPNDNQKAIGSKTPTKAELGLQQNAFIFCCFNNTYKIGPEWFAAWMRILTEVDQSVLWLLEVPDAVVNLCLESSKYGVDPARLVFAPRIPLAQHLARQKVADLFLDTLPYNAHTTASDALWAGVPVLTAVGTTFPGRVAASMLSAIGLEELITHTSQAYEARAIELAKRPDQLKKLRDKLASNRLTTPLFDTARYTLNLEKAYFLMHSRLSDGLKPEHFSA